MSRSSSVRGSSGARDSCDTVFEVAPRPFALNTKVYLSHVRRAQIGAVRGANPTHFVIGKLAVGHPGFQQDDVTRIVLEERGSYRRDALHRQPQVICEQQVAVRKCIETGPRRERPSIDQLGKHLHIGLRRLVTQRKVQRSPRPRKARISSGERSTLARGAMVLPAIEVDSASRR